MAKDCPWQTKDFDLTKSKETVAQQFAVVNSIDTMKVRVRVRVRVRVTVTVTVGVTVGVGATSSEKLMSPPTGASRMRK